MSGKRDVNQRPGESREAYRKRIVAEAPPLPEAAKIAIRRAADEYWAIVDEREAAADTIPPEDGLP